MPRVLACSAQRLEQHEMAISQERRREARDLLLRYIYDKGPEGPIWQVDPSQARRDLGLTHEECEAAMSLLIAQNLTGESYIGWIGINEAGQREAERIGVRVPMQEPPPSAVTIHANYSVVQVAAPGSTQSAAITINQTTLNQTLDRIEAELPRLPLSDAQREEAKDCVHGLRGGGLRGGALRATGAALSSILSGAGSSLGKALADAIGVAVTG